MKSSAKNISLNSYDDIFSTEETRADDKREEVMNIPLAELYPFPDHPFQVRDDDSMRDTVESIKEYGVLVPAIARPRADGGYELVSGHRRKHACELAGLPTTSVPAFALKAVFGKRIAPKSSARSAIYLRTSGDCLSIV